ncbi:hypothetical protein GOP47_0015155 [Adiantum capillus-veneris]|uniref:Uncharacterized protein n=1 Tax=Adiantum capillus-veneris TaxID=13818 RepID=A0A9D4UNQ6_ADICA|nr:hypothetical protein GOP47_0015155 [Adiantum capillus-veneris]
MLSYGHPICTAIWPVTKPWRHPSYHAALVSSSVIGHLSPFEALPNVHGFVALHIRQVSPPMELLFICSSSSLLQRHLSTVPSPAASGILSLVYGPSGCNSTLFICSSRSLPTFSWRALLMKLPIGYCQPPVATGELLTDLISTPEDPPKL